MVNNEKYIKLLKAMISCVSNGDYSSVKELSHLELEKMEARDEKIKKELNSPKTLKVRMSNINILTRWLKNILIAVMFADDGNEKEELYNIYQLKKLC